MGAPPGSTPEACMMHYAGEFFPTMLNGTGSGVWPSNASFVKESTYKGTPVEVWAYNRTTTIHGITPQTMHTKYTFQIDTKRGYLLRFDMHELDVVHPGSPKQRNFTITRSTEFDGVRPSTDADFVLTHTTPCVSIKSDATMRKFVEPLAELVHLRRSFRAQQALARSPASSPERAAAINAAQSTWTATAASIFPGETLADLATRLGTRMVSPESAPLAEPTQNGEQLAGEGLEGGHAETIPDSFDATKRWPECKSIGSIRN